MTETEATARLAKGLASGEYDNWTPDDFHKVIEELARDHARPGESEAQSYTRMITSHPAGQLLYKAYREAALGGTLTPEAPSETREDLIAKQAELDGENHARLHSAAVSLQREKPGVSYERAFSTVYTDRKNSKLVAGAKQEHLSRALRTAYTAPPVGYADDYKNPHPGGSGRGRMRVSQWRAPLRALSSFVPRAPRASIPHLAPTERRAATPPIKSTGCHGKAGLGLALLGLACLGLVGRRGGMPLKQRKNLKKL